MVENTSRDRCSIGNADLLAVQHSDLRGDAADATLGPQHGAGEQRGPGHQHVGGQRSPVDPGHVAREAVHQRLVERRRGVAVLDEQADQQGERQADRREHPGVRSDELVLPEEPVHDLEHDQPREHGHGADERDDDHVDVRMHRARGRHGSPSSRSLPTPVTVCASVVRPVSSLIPSSRVFRALPAASRRPCHPPASPADLPPPAVAWKAATASSTSR